MVEILKANKIGLQRAVAVLRAGGLVVFPTETSYGIAADACNSRAVGEVYAVKKRAREKSQPVIVANMAMARKYLHLTPLAKKFSQFFPAPLTLLVPLKRKSKLARNLTSNGKVAFRVPSNNFARALSERLGGPITSTSANISGKAPLFSVSKARGLKVDLIVNAGKLPSRLPSTIIDCASLRAVVLRQGSFRIAGEKLLT